MCSSTPRPTVRMGLSDARVIREGPTTADVYIDISPFYGMAPATGRDTASAAAATPNG